MGKRGCIWLGLSFLHFNGGMLGFYKYHCEEEVNEDVGRMKGDVGGSKHYSYHKIKNNDKK